MKSFIGFFSLTTATQICLAITQLVLLPLQLRIWGQVQTSHWLVVVALGNLASVADLGLRMAGHAQLLSSVRTGNAADGARFRQIWALARALVAGVTVALMIGQAVAAAQSSTGVEPWACAVTAAIGLDSLNIIRGMWLDTLGYFNRVEALFLAMVASRVVLFAAALLLFGASPAALGYIMLATGVAALVAQAQFVPRHRLLALSAGGFSGIRLDALRMVPLVVAEPASNWVRSSLPVLVLSAVSSPRFTTIYVALRAIFGLARQVINQLGRYASVSYAQSRERDEVAAETLLIRFTLLSTLVGLAVSCAVIADRSRLLSVWLEAVDPGAASVIALCFAAGATFYGYQVGAGALMRAGAIAAVAKRQYVYLLASGLAAAATYLLQSVPLYLVLLAMQEVVIAGLFVTAFGARLVWASFAGFAIAAVLSVLLWVAAEVDFAGVFIGSSLVPVLGSVGVLALTLGVATACYLCIDIVQRRRRWPSAISLERTAGGV